MGETLTNGEKPHSLFISHLTSYPLVSDSLSVYLDNPYGAKSVNLANDAYKRFVSPITPYFSGPYSYVSPYIAKADSLGDKGLSEVDSRFPIVKEETASLKEKLKSLPLVPYLFDSKDYVLKTYGEESKKNGGQGIVPMVKNVISTELKITGDVIGWVSSFVIQKKEEGTKLAETKIDQFKEIADELKDKAKQ